MPSLGNHRIDTTRTYVLVLRDTLGNPADISDVDMVEAVLVPYPGEPSVAQLLAEVRPPATDGAVLVTIGSADLAGLSTGEYHVLVTAVVGSARFDAAADYTVTLTGGDGTRTVEGPNALSERMIVTDMGPLMQKVGLSVAMNGWNRDLDGAFAWAWDKLGKSFPADGVRPSDAELGSLGAGIHDFRDLATYRMLLACRNRWTQVTVRTSTGQVNSSELRQDLEKRIEAMEKLGIVQQALGLSRLVGGSIELCGLYAKDPYAWDGSVGGHDGGWYP